MGPGFPASPDSVENLASTETPSNLDDNYGAVLAGYVVPPATGDYTFYICSDDNGELLLSSDENPDNAITIATEPGYDTPRNWLSKPELESAPQSLVGGRRYYLEARLKEGGGDDNLAVTWVKPGETLQPNQPPIGAEYLIPYGAVVGGNPAVTVQPLDQTVTAGANVRLRSSVVGSPPLAYQWYKDDAPIAGAIRPDYSLTALRTSGRHLSPGRLECIRFDLEQQRGAERRDRARRVARGRVTPATRCPPPKSRWAPESLTTIQGTIPDGWDNEVYQIRVTDYAHFSATVTAPEGGNSKLALFDANGMGVVYNDDQDDTTFLSAIDYATGQRPVSNGVFYLGLCSREKYFGSTVGVDAVSIWSPDTPTVQQLPDGPGKDSPFAGFGGYGGSLVNYSIALTGVGFADSGIPQAVSLRVQADGATVIISWPAGAETEGFILQQTEQLSTAAWSPAPETPVVVGSEKRVTVASPGKAGFYRLFHP